MIVSGKNRGVEKKWDPDNKTWDYNLINDPNWKPKTVFVTKKMLEQDYYDTWFNDDDLLSFDDISELKKKSKKDFENYDIKNNLKRHISLKRYAYFISVETSFFYFFYKYKTKNIYYYNNDLDNLYKSNPSLNRLKYRTSIEIPDSIKKVSGDDYLLVNYWVFKDIVIFKN